MRLASPAYLFLLLPIATLLWIELRKRTAAVRFSDASFFRARQGLAPLPAAAAARDHAAALVLAAVALARPQKGRVYEEDRLARHRHHAVHGLFAVDVGARPEARSHDRRQAAAQEFVGQRSGDRVGVTVFGNGAMTLCPLTLDKPVLNAVIDS